MLRSMTAWGEHRDICDDIALQWTLRSVNHRHLDLAMRLPESLQPIERAARERLKGRLHRGRVEVSLRIDTAARAVPPLSINKPLLAVLGDALSDVQSTLPDSAPVDALAVLNWPGMLEQHDAVNGDSAKRLQSCALASLDTALDDLLAASAREGEHLGNVIRTRIEKLAELTQQLMTLRSAVVARQQQKLTDKLKLVDVRVDPDRLATEVVLLAQRLDIDEELDRLQGHIDEVLRVLQRDEPVGRRLDFIAQELNREANTVASKSSDIDTTGITVDMKVLIEQIREQVQNLE